MTCSPKFEVSFIQEKRHTCSFQCDLQCKIVLAYIWKFLPPKMLQGLQGQKCTARKFIWLLSNLKSRLSNALATFNVIGIFQCELHLRIKNSVSEIVSATKCILFMTFHCCRVKQLTVNILEIQKCSLLPQCSAGWVTYSWPASSIQAERCNGILQNDNATPSGNALMMRQMWQRHKAKSNL